MLSHDLHWKNKTYKLKSCIEIQRNEQKWCCARISWLWYWFLLYRHVILGFTKNGRYLISYSLKIDNDDSSPLLCYVYSLHWWEFNQHKPLVEVNHAPSHIIDSQTRSSIPPKIQLMNLLFESWVRWQLQISDSSLHSCKHHEQWIYTRFSYEISTSSVYLNLM